jgi:hypothetical protein
MRTIEVPDQIADAVQQMVSTFKSKNGDYSTSDTQWASNFLMTSQYLGMPPWVSCDFNEVQKLARLTALRSRGKEPNNEAIQDTYLDKAVYAMIAYALLLHHNATAHPATSHA